MQKQLDYYKAQVTLLGIKSQPEPEMLLLEKQPKYEESSPDFMMTDDVYISAHRLDKHYTGTSNFGDKIYSFEQKSMDCSGESNALTKDSLLIDQSVLNNRI